jgi:hypothetical protein
MSAAVQLRHLLQFQAEGLQQGGTSNASGGNDSSAPYTYHGFEFGAGSAPGFMLNDCSRLVHSAVVSTRTAGGLCSERGERYPHWSRIDLIWSHAGPCATVRIISTCKSRVVSGTVGALTCILKVVLGRACLCLNAHNGKNTWSALIRCPLSWWHWQKARPVAF